MDANGSDQRRLTINGDYDWSPAWSPDGEWIVFTSNRGGNDEIYVMPAPCRDGAPGAAAWGLHRHAPWPAWRSQDGQVPADGSDQRRLTSSNSVQEVDPDWSPDGERIVFTSDRDGDEVYVMPAPYRDGQVNADGSNQRQLTDDDTTNWWPAWSPDGTKIAFASNRDGNWDIYVMPAPGWGGQVDVDGNNQQRLTEDAGRDWWPVWSPDGTRIAFHSDSDGNWDIYVVDADGKGRRQLTTSEAADQYPAWRPDIVNLE